jgi:hypothetical protein
MTKEVEQKTLDDVLDAYVAEVQEPSRAKLTEWVRRYPQFEEALTEFTVGWIRNKVLSVSPEEETDEEALVLRGMSIVQNLLHQEQNPHSPDGQMQAPISSLLEEGRSNNLPPQQLAEFVNLSLGLLAKLERRYFLFVTIPLELIEGVATAIKREVVSVARYLKGEPILPKSASFKSKRAPRVGEQRNFFDEVRADPDLSDERRRHWLRLER